MTKVNVGKLIKLASSNNMSWFVCKDNSKVIDEDEYYHLPLKVQENCILVLTITMKNFKKIATVFLKSLEMKY